MSHSMAIPETKNALVISQIVHHDAIHPQSSGMPTAVRTDATNQRVRVRRQYGRRDCTIVQ